MELDNRESPIPDVKHRDLRSAEEEYNEWGMTLLKMRADEKFNKMVGYNRWDVFKRRKDLLKQMAILKCKGLGNEVPTRRTPSAIGVPEFSQEDVYVSGTARRHIYRQTGDDW